MKYVKIILSIILLLLIYFGCCKAIKWGETYINSMTSNLKSDIPVEYLQLLNIDSNDVRFSNTIFVDQSAISSLNYQDSIVITALRLDASPNWSLMDGISVCEDLTSLGIDGGVFYAGFENGMTKISYSYDYEFVKVNSIDIHLPRSGDIKSLIRSDTLCSYFIPNSYGLKVKLNDRNHSDIVIETSPKGIFEKSSGGNDNTTNLLFLLRRHQGHIYLFLFNRLSRGSKEIDDSDLFRFIGRKD